MQGTIDFVSSNSLYGLRTRTEGEYSLQIFDEVGDQGVVGNDIHLRNQTRITP